MQRTMVFVLLIATSFFNPAEFTAKAADLTMHGGVLGNPFYFQFLGTWLQNRAIPLSLNEGDFRRSAIEVKRFIPAKN